MPPAFRGSLTRILGRIRRPTEAPDPAAGPSATYARVLDGQTLWLAVGSVTGTGSRLALRHVESGRVLPVSTDVVRFGLDVELSARVSLTCGDVALPPDGWATMVAVVIEPDRDEPLRIRPPRAIGQELTKTPLSPDGRWEFTVEEAADGLRIVRRPAPPMARAEAFWKTASTVGFSASVPEGIEPIVLLVSPGGQVVRSVPMTADDGTFGVELAEPDVPAPPGIVYKLAVGTPETPVPVMRAANDLRRPNPAVHMPEVPRTDGSRTPLVKMRWVQSGQLAVVRPVGEESVRLDDGAETVDGTAPEREAAP